MLGVALSLLGVITGLAAVVLIAVVIWLEVSHGPDIPYFALCVRVVVIGGFLLVLAWLLWQVGTSMTARRSVGADGEE
jgi:H+/Cl- antiporter ClcA